jgi:simple sugar transport system ATP-binding protein
MLKLVTLSLTNLLPSTKILSTNWQQWGCKHLDIDVEGDQLSLNIFLKYMTGSEANMSVSTRPRETRKLNDVPEIDFQNISKLFGGVHALSNIDFEVLSGEVHCIAGENGCGKSTLIKIISGVYTPEHGADMKIRGQQFKSLTPGQARNLGIEVIWQDHALFPEMRVDENIAFESLVGLRPSLVKYDEIRNKAEQVCTRLGVNLDLDAQVKDLPIAQRQLVAVCRALVSQAKIIFMDEPTASLTQSETTRLLDIVRTLSAEGVAVVFVSHRLAEVLEIANRVTVLRDGNKVGVYEAEGMTQARLTELMTGLTINQSVNDESISETSPVLELSKLSRKGEYEDISLTICEGEVVGITGLLGSGRTELALSLFGITKPSRGEMRLGGEIVKFRSNLDAIKSGVAYVSEDRLALGLIQEQSIADNLILSVLDKILTFGRLISFRKKNETVEYWISELNVKIGKTTDAISTLSGGNQQKIVIAKWLATNPKLLILDSPTVGVDVGAREGIFKIVRELAKQGLAILLISDEVSEVYFNSNRVLHMSHGRIEQQYIPAQCEILELENAVFG